MNPWALGLIVGGTWLILGTLLALAFGQLCRVGMYDEPSPAELDATARALLSERVPEPHIAPTVEATK